MDRKIVIFVGKESQFRNSGVGKYVSYYIPFLEKKYDVEIFYQPEEHNVITGNFWRVFKLPHIIKKDYKDYVKIFSDENFLTSVRGKYVKSSIAVVHHYPFMTKVNNIKENIIRWLSFITFNTVLRQIHHIVVVSNKTKSVLRGIGIKEKYMTVIPTSLDLSCFNILNNDKKIKKREELSKKYIVPTNKKWLLYVGTNESRKNLTTLFRVLSKLSDEYILIRVGKDCSTEELNEMNKIIDENNLKNRYYHLQDLTEEDLISLYQISDIYLMPSLYEGFGRPIIEAQACGCPVISTKCGALEEVCGDGALLVNDPVDENEYVRLIDKIFIERKKLIKKGRLNAEQYSTELNAEKLDSLVAKLF